MYPVVVLTPSYIVNDPLTDCAMSTLPGGLTALNLAGNEAVDQLAWPAGTGSVNKDINSQQQQQQQRVELTDSMEVYVRL